VTSWVTSRRSLLKYFLLSGGALAVASCRRSPSGAGTASAPGRISIGTTLKVSTLDPADAYAVFPGILLHNLGDRLYTYKPGTTEIAPQLATKLPEVSADGLTYKITLREGVTFHDGTPFNAEAMAFSIQRFAENGGGPSFILSDRLESVTATSPTELTIKLKAPFAGFPALLTFSGLTPVSPKAYEIGENKFKPTQFIGTGPYKLAQMSSTTIRLDPNPAYWGEKPVNQGLDIQIIPSAANLYNAFRTGNLDIAYQTLDPDQIRTLEAGATQGGYQVIKAGGTSINYLTLNSKMKPFDQVKVRQAIAALVDRNLLQERVFQGQAESLYSLLPTKFPGYKPVFKDQYGDANYEKAKTLLTEAGFSAAKPLTLDIWYSSTSIYRNLAATTLKAAVEKALPGIVKIATNTVESATLNSNLDKGTYAATIADWYPDFYDADNYFQPFLSCDKGSAAGCEEGQSKAGGSFYFSDRANELIEKQRNTADPAARTAIFSELQDLLAQDVPYIPLWQSIDYVFAQKAIAGVAIQPTQQILFGAIKKA
jgi:peptide/nickel transport system substrate-binding protein